MNGLRNPPATAAMPFETEDYVTAAGGLASCPTGGDYWHSVQTETPADGCLWMWPLDRSTAGRRLAARPSETRGSYDPDTLFAMTVMTVAHHRPATVEVEHVFPYEVIRPTRHPIVAFTWGVEDWAQTMEAVEQAEQAPAHEDPGPRAWEAFKELTGWLEATDAEVAGAIGIGRTTVYGWQREGREPRRGSARRLYELHATLRALSRRLGEEGLRAWLAGGRPSRRALLVEGGLASVADAVDEALFDGSARLDLAAAPADRGPVDNAPTVGSPRRPPGRRIRRSAPR